MPQPARNTIILLILLTAPAFAEQPMPTPTLPTDTELRARRAEIYQELDQNVANVKQCFEALDDIPETDVETRQFLETQIQQFDDRSSALHAELEEIDRFEFLAKHRHELVQQVTRLEGEAEQLRKAGHPLQAKLRQAKARSIQKTLDDGTWKILASEDWCEDSTPGPDLISVLQLNIEVENLKQETTQLRKEITALRETVHRLEKLLHDRTRSTP